MIMYILLNEENYSKSNQVCQLRLYEFFVPALLPIRVHGLPTEKEYMYIIKIMSDKNRFDASDMGHQCKEHIYVY